MTLTPTAAPTSAPTTALSPTARQLWRRSRWFLLGAAVLLLAALLVGGLGDSGGYPALDPRSADPDGGRATAQLLRQQGITVDPVDTPAALDDSAGADTVLLPLPDLLSPDQLRALAAAGHRRVILISPGDAALSILAPDVHPAEAAGVPLGIASASTQPSCSLPEAQRAGSVQLGGQLYAADDDTLACYPREGHPSLVRTTEPSGTEVIVLGSGRFLTNQALAQDGNASLALGLLGAQPHLTWYLPDYSSAPQQAQQRSFTDLIPRGWSWAALQLALAAVLAALWRARRLGPVVSEDLPVVVRAAETTEGRARLYQRAKAREQAATSLRRAARHRLAAVLGVPLTVGEPDGTALLTALAGRLPAPVDPGGPHALLYGPPPTDDAALLRLADDLDALERQVRQP
ncbi:hypothetical protein P3T36_003154 [Kitasatospora sp. MAP12-15]|uniref:DUF4350 domain-containing protein n=1 Tax=unclassified Kitasatospora TaxID=2633591 RepID=UPI0024758369|nr:DUF4350 domain-containing protein [Kitasatospora sp. MAP12-44]MDH6110785.1 hypothetical protein [Kitasatospora sp. MAP12-44]